MSRIETLNENQIFVFGSNARGFHMGGAARQAVESFGAIMGQAEGLQGQSYAIVTLDEEMHRVSLWYIEEQLEKLRDFAIQNPDKEFLLTAIGCGIAGFEISTIAAVCRDIANWPSNVVFPCDFLKYFDPGNVDISRAAECFVKTFAEDSYSAGDTFLKALPLSWRIKIAGVEASKEYTVAEFVGFIKRCVGDEAASEIVKVYVNNRGGAAEEEEEEQYDKVMTANVKNNE